MGPWAQDRPTKLSLFLLAFAAFMATSRSSFRVRAWLGVRGPRYVVHVLAHDVGFQDAIQMILSFAEPESVRFVKVIGGRRRVVELQVFFVDFSIESNFGP